jgi:putative membrane protein
MKAETFFTETEQQRIAAAIHEAESRTSGEIAVMVVAQSDDYPEGQVLAAGCIGSLLAFAGTELVRPGSLWVFVLAALGLIALCGGLVRYLPAVKRFFTADERLERQVRYRALAAFYEKGLYRTRDESGVLFFISLFERKVWVLADRGIHARIRPETLQSFAGDIALGMKSGNAAEVLCRQIRAAGEMLASHFPRQPGDVNELPDDVITGK